MAKCLFLGLVFDIHTLILEVTDFFIILPIFLKLKTKFRKAKINVFLKFRNCQKTTEINLRAQFSGNFRSPKLKIIVLLPQKTWPFTKVS